MPTAAEVTLRDDRHARTMRWRAAPARTFAPLFVAMALVLILPGCIFLYDAFSNPLTADSAQVMLGSICLAVSLLLIFFLVRQGR
jgi:hypothetical protein